MYVQIYFFSLTAPFFPRRFRGVQHLAVDDIRGLLYDNKPWNIYEQGAHWGYEEERFQ
jgi:hypothetical protein